MLLYCLVPDTHYLKYGFIGMHLLKKVFLSQNIFPSTGCIHNIVTLESEEHK